MSTKTKTRQSPCSILKISEQGTAPGFLYHFGERAFSTRFEVRRSDPPETWKDREGGNRRELTRLNGKGNRDPDRNQSVEQDTFVAMLSKASKSEHLRKEDSEDIAKALNPRGFKGRIAIEEVLSRMTNQKKDQDEKVGADERILVPGFGQDLVEIRVFDEHPQSVELPKQGHHPRRDKDKVLSDLERIDREKQNIVDANDEKNGRKRRLRHQNLLVMDQKKDYRAKCPIVHTNSYF